MDGTLFKSLSSLYNLKSEYTIETEENYHSAFSCKYHVNAVWNSDTDCYNYTILRSDVRINEKPIRKLMDRVMFEIGDSIYPLILSVSPLLQILDVTNLEEIKMRWKTCTQNLLEKYPSHQMQRYIKMSEKNMLNKENFMNTLYQDTFFNVYFRDIYTPTEEDEARAILWTNFPKREMNQTYLYDIDRIEDNKINTSGDIMQIVPEHQGHYNTDYEIGKKNEIHSISGKIESKFQEKLYTKQISVQTENLKMDSHFTENVILE